jgi:hypothetical protein
MDEEGFFYWLHDVNRGIFGRGAESVLDYPEVPWLSWYRQGVARGEAVRRFREDSPEDDTTERNSVVYKETAQWA